MDNMVINVDTVKINGTAVDIPIDGRYSRGLHVVVVNQTSGAVIHGLHVVVVNQTSGAVIHERSMTLLQVLTSCLTTLHPLMHLNTVEQLLPLQ